MGKKIMNPDEPIPYKITTEAMLLDDIRILTENNAALQAELDAAKREIADLRTAAHAAESK